MLNINQKPKISVILPFYNAKAFLVEAIDSVLNQTFTDFELILIDDNSSDGSSLIAENYQKIDERVSYYKNSERLGIVKNLNKGLELAQADIIARMDGDDICDTQRLEKQFNFLISHPEISVVGSFVSIIDEDGNLIDKRTKLLNHEEIKKNILTYSPFVHPAVMFRKQDVIKVGGYRGDYGFNEDLDLWFRLAYSGFKLANLSEFLLKYRYHQNSTAHQYRTNAIDLYRLRKDTIKNYHLNVSWKTRLMVAIQLLVGVVFSGRKRQSIEKWYKIIFYHAK